MSNSFFKFKQFTIHQDKCAMKVTTDSCLFGAWVAQQLSESKNDVSTVLDIGGGTGLLSLMLAQKNNTAKIDVLEIDIEATAQAKENVEQSPFSNQIQIINADARTYHFSKKYNVIISNPPFYENELKGNDAVKNIAHHNDGLSITELLKIIKDNLAANGKFFLLLPYKRFEEIKKLIQKEELGVTKVVFVKQSENHSYFRVLVAGTNTSTNTNMEAEINITTKTRQYTAEFIELLKDYYLYL
ncbi:MAG: methyltransferase [Bacteroidetes bacterium]|nr:methyltransferase [Bacteroidota bacterium]